MAQAQATLDAKIEELEKEASESESEDEELYGDKSSHKSTPPPPSPHKQSLLRDDDEELIRLGAVLESVHDRFYRAYKRSVEGMAKEKQLSRLEGRGRTTTETGKLPDIRDIMTEMRGNVLGGVVLVFSGVIPLNVNWQTYCIYRVMLKVVMTMRNLQDSLVLMSSMRSQIPLRISSQCG